MVAKVPSTQPLDPSIFMVSFSGVDRSYTLNIPKSLVPLVLSLGNFTIIKEDSNSKYLFETKEVKVITTGSGRLSDDNWCTVRLHKNEVTPIAVIRVKCHDRIHGSARGLPIEWLRRTPTRDAFAIQGGCGCSLCETTLGGARIHSLNPFLIGVGIRLSQRVGKQLGAVRRHKRRKRVGNRIERVHRRGGPVPQGPERHTPKTRIL